MYALLITFTSSVDAEDMAADAAHFAEAVRAVPGFVAKTWLHEGAHHGGFYLFTDRAAAEAYRDGPLVAGLRAHPAFSDLEVRGWPTNTELGALTGAIPAPATA
ncbi:YdhR family protein [Actinomycetospora straminea]|uniref:Monooxygenase ydhR n=1 Tax=Actinomycetospora straminea TaxID=663607 RepID=A0ABP9FCK4_9PSEU|nr:YdhR family protein [Actinomycetospora straminea]MDD7934082.1 YdhR family protein [Actinomycetospora straminea]